MDPLALLLKLSHVVLAMVLVAGLIGRWVLLRRAAASERCRGDRRGSRDLWPARSRGWCVTFIDVGGRGRPAHRLGAGLPVARADDTLDGGLGPHRHSVGMAVTSPDDLPATRAVYSRRALVRRPCSVAGDHPMSFGRPSPTPRSVPPGRWRRSESPHRRPHGPEANALKPRALARIVSGCSEVGAPARRGSGRGRT